MIDDTNNNNNNNMESSLSIYSELATSKQITSKRITHASSCIIIHHLNNKFNPIFTHQLFDNEIIKGYEPYDNIGYKYNSNNNGNNNNNSACSDGYSSSSSGSNGSNSNKKKIYLSIDIYLSPCCRNCKVDFHLWKKEHQRHHQEIVKKKTSVLERIKTRSNNDSKRRGKLSNGSTSITSDGDDSSYNIESCNSSTSSCIEDDDDEVIIVEPQDSKTLSLVTTRNQITLHEISDILNKALPNRISTTGLPNTTQKQPQDINKFQIMTRKKKRKNIEITNATNNIQDDYLDYPLGDELHDYNTKNKDFVLSLADGQDKDVIDYHNQVQNMSLWFIETADAVDVSDTKEGQWKILYLFQKHSVDVETNDNIPAGKKRKRHGSGSEKKYKYSFVGYMTLFYFYAPFKKPKSGYIIRICQIFILPSYQRYGHGTKMMLTLYTYIHEQKNIIELTVEDPAPTCTALRDYIDFELFKYCYSNSNNDNDNHTNATTARSNNKSNNNNKSQTNNTITKSNNETTPRITSFRKDDVSGTWTIYFYYDKLRNLGRYKTHEMAETAFELLKSKVASSTPQQYNDSKSIDDLMQYVRNTVRGGSASATFSNKRINTKDKNDTIPTKMPIFTSIFSSFPLSSSCINKKSSMIEFNNNNKNHDNSTINNINDCTILSDKDAIKYSSILKITPKQFHRIYELYKIVLLHHALTTKTKKKKTAKEKDDLMKKYRLFIKKRLNKLYREDLDEWKDDIKARKEHLALMFDEVFKYYCAICKIEF